MYELTARYLSAGYAGESRPRCIIPFSPESSRRMGDHRQWDPEYAQRTRKFRLQAEWAAGYELYQTDLRELDTRLVEDKLERALRTVHTDHLQMDAKSRKVVLVVPSLLPTPLLEIALKAVFGHFTQPPSVSILTCPVLCCASAGLRNALVVDIGWEETVVTVVGEYKEIAQRRSVRAGKALTREMATTIEQAASQASEDPVRMTFDEAEDLVQRIAWCQPKPEKVDSQKTTSPIRLTIPGSNPIEHFSLPFDALAEPAERALFASEKAANEHDDHDLPLHLLAYRALLSLPRDLRSTCIERIVVVGTSSNIPGLRRRLLQELSNIVGTRGWDIVNSYGSATAIKTPRTPSLAPEAQTSESTEASAATATAAAAAAATESEAESESDRAPTPTAPAALEPGAAPFIPAGERAHDDVDDPITQKAERAARRAAGKSAVRDSNEQGPPVRGVESLGAWAGASLVASLRVRGVHEVEREDFLKHGFRGL